MPDPILVGLLDSGASGAVLAAVDAGRAFHRDASGEIRSLPAGDDQLGHGTALARIILRGAPQARLVVAQVFGASRATSPAIVAAGLSWLVDQGVRVVNMSLGLHADRAVLRTACAAALAARVILIAAAPARGPQAFPGAYAGVIRVSGDARCGPDDVSDLWGRQADFGACPRGPDAPGTGTTGGGASFATAHASAIVANYLAATPEADAAMAMAHLRRMARYHGPEHHVPERRAPTDSADG
jgi:subtilisin family serine protease